MTTLNDYVALKADFDRLVQTLEWIIRANQVEQKTTIEVDPAGNTYSIEMVDGGYAREARAALAAVRR